MKAPGLTNSRWRKSSHSGQNGNCVELANADRSVAVRDSKAPSGPVIVLTLAEWECLIRGVGRAGAGHAFGGMTG
ncbi:DUF397 domain-containing protein [Actinomadura rupiterrae]|uniref:DUF397 domain-containing protein n=1 Tax=Actinomadura rupiterrae TaxID=559627 RepID=UPI0020A3EB95|nr:DUF397 domain-containing protein [Actinomadura rupiterrae]MCP2338622.1 hypothetical protein [Actinomadura rupiterrae]